MPRRSCQVAGQPTTGQGRPGQNRHIQFLRCVNDGSSIRKCWEGGCLKASGHVDILKCTIDHWKFRSGLEVKSILNQFLPKCCRVNLVTLNLEPRTQMASPSKPSTPCTPSVSHLSLANVATKKTRFRWRPKERRGPSWVAIDSIRTSCRDLDLDEEASKIIFHIVKWLEKSSAEMADVGGSSEMLWTMNSACQPVNWNWITENQKLMHLSQSWFIEVGDANILHQAWCCSCQLPNMHEAKKVQQDLNV